MYTWNPKVTWIKVMDLATVTLLPFTRLKIHVPAFLRNRDREEKSKRYGETSRVTNPQKSKPGCETFQLIFRWDVGGRGDSDRIGCFMMGLRKKGVARSVHCRGVECDSFSCGCFARSDLLPVSHHWRLPCLFYFTEGEEVMRGRRVIPRKMVA